MNNRELQDKVVLIIGAGRSPGPALAQALAAQGAIIAANDFSPVTLDQTAELVHACGGRIHTYVGDATRGMPLRAILDEVLEDLDRVDILINNPRVQPTASVLTMDEWDWQRTIETNLNGPFLVTKLVGKIMQEQGGGTVINIVDADPTSLEAQGRTAYAASQQGLMALSQGVAREFIAYNIRVFTLCPEMPGDQTGNASTDLPGAADWADDLNQWIVRLCSQGDQFPPGQVFRVGARGDNQRQQE